MRKDLIRFVFIVNVVVVCFILLLPSPIIFQHSNKIPWIELGLRIKPIVTWKHKNVPNLIHLIVSYLKKIYTYTSLWHCVAICVKARGSVEILHLGNRCQNPEVNIAYLLKKWAKKRIWIKKPVIIHREKAKQEN